MNSTAQVGSQCFTKQQCYVQAVTLNPQDVDAWKDLGRSLRSGDSVQVGSQYFTNQQCFVQALTFSPKDADAWKHLGRSLRSGEAAQVGSQCFTKQQCYVQALTLNPKDADAWNNLGAALGVGPGWESALHKAAMFLTGIDIEPKEHDGVVSPCEGPADAAMAGLSLYEDED